eukprot:TRINITY_DN14189_c0_g1_i1.p1 TRINITY_DN14189_c0_g1~~TRINITY_DN14189_c0_g1_i1.p1  ORF type:complete len:106 (-),score=5.16 TRINITY_DN14189_c0_g1_i1:259-576(-)
MNKREETKFLIFPTWEDHTTHTRLRIMKNAIQIQILRFICNRIGHSLILTITTLKVSSKEATTAFKKPIIFLFPNGLTNSIRELTSKRIHVHETDMHSKTTHHTK